MYIHKMYILLYKIVIYVNRYFSKSFFSKDFIIYTMFLFNLNPIPPFENEKQIKTLQINKLV